ncbi:MAG: glycoside hydrolase 43 family protein [Bacteroidales bacterium]|jgi:beta-xylosidase|nr:glycoside hydrolase 43 family protein [Bacteroidales bacterium]
MKTALHIVISLILISSFMTGGCRHGQAGQETTYTNPVLHSDYSDPDVVRSGDSYYMVASSFNCVPGLPVLRSDDLVYWELVGYALERLHPEGYYSEVRHGGGIWAPCIRLHNGEFYIYYPDPDHGIFMVRASDPAGPWSDPVEVIHGRGLIDPTPLWDDDGSAYLAYAFAGSRAGIKSVLMVTRMSYDGTTATGDPVMVFDGHDGNPTVEGPKFYRRKGWYYIFAPAGGVTEGWQLVLRSRNVFGPYEHRMVLHKGSTGINGPHQGAWVTTHSGEDWFIHFQDKGAYGRIVHLQPMKWADDWPVIGADEDGDGIGEPVSSFTRPVTGAVSSSHSSRFDDEFDGSMQPFNWQWQANPSVTWGYPSEAYGFFRLNCIARPDGMRNLWEVPNLFLRKLPAEKFTATASVDLNLRFDGEEAGMVVMGRDYRYLSVRRSGDKLFLREAGCADANLGSPEAELWTQELQTDHLWLRLDTDAGAVCRFSYSTDGENFTFAPDTFTAHEGIWIGAKVGFFALRDGFINDAGSIDLNWFRILTTD